MGACSATPVALARLDNSTKTWETHRRNGFPARLISLRETRPLPKEISMRGVTRKTVNGLGLLVLVALGSACAAARVQNVQQATQPSALPRPGRVIVFDFDTGSADVVVGTSPRRSVRNAVGLYVTEADTLAQSVSDSLANQLVDALKASGFAAERAAKATPPGPRDLVIQGQFVQIDQGSATKRFVIGLGVGATELRTQVQVFQVGTAGWQPVKQFDTVAQGARFPGAAFFVAGGAVAGTAATSAMVSSGVGVVREIRTSIEADARRTAEQITSKLSELSKSQGW